MSDKDLEAAILSLVPADGSSIGNIKLRQQMNEKLGHAVPQEEYDAARDALVEQGLLKKGRGRGGSVARSFRGDKDQFIPLIQADFKHPVLTADYIEPKVEIRAAYEEGEAMPVELRDGSTIVLNKIDQDYDPSDRAYALDYLEAHREKAEIVTGLLSLSLCSREERVRQPRILVASAAETVVDQVARRFQ